MSDLFQNRVPLAGSVTVKAGSVLLQRGAENIFYDKSGKVSFLKNASFELTEAFQGGIRPNIVCSYWRTMYIHRRISVVEQRPI